MPARVVSWSTVVGQLPLPTAEGAIFAGIVLLALLIALLIVTLGTSVYERRRDLRRERVRDDVEMAILSRMSEAEPAWDEWVPTLSEPERWVARETLDEYLRTLTGTEWEALVELAHELDVPSDAKTTLRDSPRHERLQALGWLTLLEEPVEPAVLRETCTDDNDLRAAAARVLFEANHPEAKRVGTDLLLGDGTLTLSVHGLDTLYRLHREDPTQLLERGQEMSDDWRPSLLVQVLSVVSECGLTAQDAPWDWVFAYTGHEAPSVRAAAVEALGLPGWDSAFRDRADTTRLVTDPHRNVRRATYRTLAEWGDDESVELLAAGAARETDQRSRVLAFQQLAEVDRLTDEVLTTGQARVADDRAFTPDSDDDTQVGDSGATLAATVPTANDLDTQSAQQTDTSVATDVAVDWGTTADDEVSYDRALRWVRANQEARHG